MHAMLSPSASSRWLKCTASANIEAFCKVYNCKTKPVPEVQTSQATLGTLAHQVAEVILKQYGEVIPLIHKFDTDLHLYTDYCFNLIDQADKDYGIEEMITIDKKYAIFGSIDFWALVDNKLHIVDLKYGTYPVNAENNSQLMLYAKGMLESPKLQDKPIIDEIKITIIQPRLQKISAHSISTTELLNWYKDQEKNIKAAYTYKNHKFHKSTSTCKFCPIKPVCPEHKDESLTHDDLVFAMLQVYADHKQKMKTEGI